MFSDDIYTYYLDRCHAYYLDSGDECISQNLKIYVFYISNLLNINYTLKIYYKAQYKEN